MRPAYVGAKGTPNYLDFWRRFDVAPSPAGSYNIFRDHLLTNVCDGDPALFNYVFGWMAHIVQKPRERLGSAIVLRGRRGTGKSKFGEVLGSLFASHYFQVDDARYITGQFNEHMASCLLLQADEAVWAGDKAAEGRLKDLITSEMQMIESKGVNAIRMRNFVRVRMAGSDHRVAGRQGSSRHHTRGRGRRPKAELPAPIPWPHEFEIRSYVKTLGLDKWRRPIK